MWSSYHMMKNHFYTGTQNICWDYNYVHTEKHKFINTNSDCIDDNGLILIYILLFEKKDNVNKLQT